MVNRKAGQSSAHRSGGGLEPYFALRYILTKLPETSPDRLSDLLPWNIDPLAFHELIAEDARISLASIPVDLNEP
ncbi:MAG: hypothetical protein ACOYM2_15510 [Rectinemataceae bacterium]